MPLPIEQQVRELRARLCELESQITTVTQTVIVGTNSTVDFERIQFSIGGADETALINAGIISRSGRTIVINQLNLIPKSFSFSLGGSEIPIGDDTSFTFAYIPTYTVNSVSLLFNADLTSGNLFIGYFSYKT